MKNKNIWLIPTDKPSRLYSYKSNLFLTTESHLNVPSMEYQNIYITSDEEIKIGEYQLYNPLGNFDNAKVSKAERLLQNDGRRKKIILTTDQDLIKDGVQAIDDEFLQWFVKNPSCEEIKTKLVEQRSHLTLNDWVDEDKNGKFPISIAGAFCYRKIYKIIIPKEELKSFSDFSDKFFGSIQKEEPKKVLTEEDIFNQRDIDVINAYIKIDQLVDEEAKKIQKQHLIDMMKDDEELGLYGEGSIEFNEMCKEDLSLTKVDILELMRRAYNAGYNQYNIVEAGLEGKDTEENIRWILTKYKTEKSENAKRKRNFYCGDKVDYDEQCLEQCDRCVDATGVDYGYYDETNKI